MGYPMDTPHPIADFGLTSRTTTRLAEVGARHTAPTIRGWKQYGKSF